MTQINRSFANRNEKLEFIDECEKRFERRLDEVSGEIVRSGTRIVALSGPTCAGKTTTAAKLTADLEKAGADVYLVSIDNFFHDREALDRFAAEKGIPLDYDSVNAINLELLAERTASILRGDPTDLPVFNFELAKCTHFERVDPDERSVFIFEGIQAVYPEVTPLFGDNFRSVFINVEEDLEYNGVFFGKRERRLLRRLVRDFKFRGASPDFTFHIWRSVAANEDKAIFPYVDESQLRIDSGMEYDVCLMKSVLPEVLALVEPTSPHYPKALELLGKLDKLDIIGADMIPKTSLMREFIG